MADNDTGTADLDKCGAGKEAECCVFLMAGPDGIECARGTGLHDTLVERIPTMTAKRYPTIEYPYCQLELAEVEG